MKTTYAYTSAPYALLRRTAVILASVLLLTATAGTQVRAQSIRWNQAYQNYIEQYKDIAIEQMLLHRIPASITLAQGLLESGAGKSALAAKGNNHFGIKCHDWTGASMRVHDDLPNECFRVYNNPRESFEDHSQFLKRPRYQRLFSLSIKNYKGWARGLKACGYATSPTYAKRLIDIIETYQLDQYDRAKTYNKYVAAQLGSSYGATAAQTLAQGAHRVYYNNKNYYVVARQGDTFRQIGKEFDVSYRKLARYNERDKKDILSAGDIVYLEKKRTKAEKEYKKRPHTIQTGESMYSIAQKYGIRLKYLYKRNDLSPDYTPRVGDQLKLR